MRIIGIDEIQLFYEISDKYGWSVRENLNKEIHFYGASTSYFKATYPVYLGFEEFNSTEINIIQPELPIAIGREKRMTWDQVVKFNIPIKETLNNKILCGAIYLYPLGPKGGLVKPTLIAAKNENHFTIGELISKAAELQSETFTLTDGGIGLYRLGIKSKMPTYYIDRYFPSRTQAYRQYEDKFDWNSYLNTQNKIEKPVRAQYLQNGIFQLKFILDNLESSHYYFIIISATSNNVIVTESIAKSEMIIDLSTQPQGNYWLNLFQGKEMIYRTTLSL